MLFDGIVGSEENGEASRCLENMIHRDAVGNTILFAGPDREVLEGFGNRFVRQVLGIGLEGAHPDLHHYYPEGKVAMHSIDSMRELREQVSLHPSLAKRKCFVLHDADRMQQESANALLKTFEEPSEETLILLLTSNPEMVLPTIRSRCRTLFFKPAVREKIGSSSIKLAVETAIAKVPYLRHGDLLREVDAIHQWVEAEIKRIESERIKQYGQEAYADLNAVQKDRIDREAQGLGALEYVNLVDEILSTVIEDARAKAREKGDWDRLDRSIALCSQMRKRALRSTPLNIWFETLLLNLK
jgi:DNA polymerase III delta prime subunit